VIARQTIYHDRDHSSVLILPIIPRNWIFELEQRIPEDPKTRGTKSPLSPKSSCIELRGSAI